jgi:hypothetical protein
MTGGGGPHLLSRLCESHTAVNETAADLLALPPVIAHDVKALGRAS